MNQEIAFSILKAGQNVYLTGSAGTGKTYLLNQYIEYLRVHEVPVAVTASTGIAATHIAGQTIHSWSGIGINDLATKEVMDRISLNRQTVSRLREVKVLIIDEISMLSGKVLTAVSDVLKHFRNNKEPFGGVQLILTGDFFQLPPVSREQISNREKFAFMAPVWVEARLRVCYLTQQFRQRRDMLSIVLSEIRDRAISDDSLDRLREKLEDKASKADALRLFTHNADVDAMNARKLAENPHPVEVFYAETKGKSKILDGLMQSVLAPQMLELKLEAKVMFVKNNPEKGYFNGTVGTISGFDEETNYPLVKLESEYTLIAKPEEWTVADERETILASYKQVPLRLAWAITVHKSQGMTLEEAEMDLSKTFESGQGYVALSRLKSWEGLFLNGINHTSLEVDPLAYKADRRFQELSEENEDWITNIPQEHLKADFRAFITRCGGTNDPMTILQNEQREKKYYKKKEKTSTYEVTKNLLVQGKKLDEIAFEREMTLGTIVGHLERIKITWPEVDLTPHQPAPPVLKKIKGVVSKLKAQASEELLDKDGNVRIGAIYAALNGQMDYETIRLAKLFAD